nr:DegQ family serine endoprotease [uncultured Devosia sp.]
MNLWLIVPKARTGIHAVALTIAALFCSPAVAQTVAVAPIPTLADVVEDAVPAVVSISVESVAPSTTNPLYSDPFFRHYFGLPQPQPEVQLSAGSGVIVDADAGYVLTNYHVIADGQEITATLSDGRTLAARLIGSDQATDIALLQIDAENLTEIGIRDSSELRVGDYVVAIGNPFGIGQTVTSGIVSALGRSGLDIEGYEDFIQTDASINPGNSGGALISLDGKLVGINTAILAPAGGNVGIGFAVPSNIATAVMAQILEHGEVRRGQLGLNVQDLTPELAAALGADGVRGALVTSVETGSSADLAGVEPGDIVMAIGGRRVVSSVDLRNRMGLAPIGTTVQLSILRNGGELELNAKIGEAPQASAISLSERFQGATLRDLTPDEALLGLSGVVVSEVAPGSPAEAAGMLAGDLIVAMNRSPIGNVEALASGLAEQSGTFALQIIRRGAPLILFLR